MRWAVSTLDPRDNEAKGTSSDLATLGHLLLKEKALGVQTLQQVFFEGAGNVIDGFVANELQDIFIP